MPNGKLVLFRKDNFSSFATLDIDGNFNIEDNLNETPSNMKIKAITTNAFREEFEVNTVAFHEDTNTWWVIKSDESTYLHTGEYEHEIQLVELLEFYSFRHLPNCAFAPNTYTLQQMLNRLFSIGKLTSPTLTIPNPLPSFLDQNKIMPFLSFENFTVANAIKNIARSINAIPKVSANYSVSGGVLYSINSFVLTFINREGLPNAILENLNSQFEVAYEKNTNSSDQFLTRSVSNITNAKSSTLVIVPKQGGFKNITPNSLTYNQDNAKVFLPSKIDKVEFIRIFPPMELVYVNSGGSVIDLITTGYYIDRTDWYNKLVAKSFGGFSTAEKQAIADELPEPNEHFKVNYGETDISASYDNIPSIANPFGDPKIRMFGRKMTIYSKFEFDTINTATYPDLKDRSVHWNPFTNELIMPLSFRNGLDGTTDHNRVYRLYRNPFTENEVWLRPIYRLSGFFNNKIANDQILIQVGYYPISDIKVSVDNDSESQDEKFFNQSGKVIDAVSVSKLITSHTNDSVEGTKIRNAKYESPSDILPIGQLVRDSNQVYVITQRSIDGQIKNGNQYYNVLYTLSRNRIARSENIIADSSVISYKTPDDNLVFRTQLYKDYIELSLTNQPKDIPYLDWTKLLVFQTGLNSLAGTNLDFTILADARYKETPLNTTVVRHIANGSIFDLHKSKLININYQDNNVLGYRLDSTSGTYVQTPVVYTNSRGESTFFELLFLDTENLTNAINHYNSTYTPKPFIPFTDLTQIDNLFYGNSVSTQGNYSIAITENNYSKDPFEIPVFEYMVQGNDNFDPKGNVVMSNDLFTTFTGNIRYHYVINNSTRFTAENADRLRNNTTWSGSDRVVGLTRVNATQFLLDLYSSFPTTKNSNPIVNIGIYAIDTTTNNVKFLFAVNDYTLSNTTAIVLYLNNWKI